MTIFVKPSAQIELDHRAFLFSGLSGHSGFAVASEEGFVTVISPDLKEHVTFKRPEKIQSISTHPIKPLLAIVEGHDSHLSFVDLDSLSTHDAQSARIDEEWTPNRNLPGVCFFSSDGRYLWYAVAHASDDEIEVRLLESDDWRLVDKVIIEDPYGDSRLSLYAAGSSLKVALWLAAGQDGQQVYWLTSDADKIACEIEPHLADTLPPVFSPSGQEFLVTDGSMVLSKYQFPDVHFLREYQWPDAEEQEEAFGYSLCYIGQERALVISSLDCLFLFDLMQMTVSDEVWIEGHEPKPTPVYYPSLADDGSLCTDISQFQCLGDMLVFVFRRDQGVGLTDWKDSLLFLPVAALTAQTE